MNEMEFYMMNVSAEGQIYQIYKNLISSVENQIHECIKKDAENVKILDFLRDFQSFVQFCEANQNALNGTLSTSDQQKLGQIKLMLKNAPVNDQFNAKLSELLKKIDSLFLKTTKKAPGNLLELPYDKLVEIFTKIDSLPDIARWSSTCPIMREIAYDSTNWHHSKAFQILTQDANNTKIRSDFIKFMTILGADNQLKPFCSEIGCLFVNKSSGMVLKNFLNELSLPQRHAFFNLIEFENLNRKSLNFDNANWLFLDPEYNLETMLKEFPMVENLRLTGVKDLRDSDFQIIAKVLPKLQALDLTGSKNINGTGLKCLESLKDHLEKLNLMFCSGIDSVNFQFLASLSKIKELNLFGLRNLNPQNGQFLKSMIELRKLIFANTGITDAFLANLNHLNKTLDTLDLTNCALTGEGLTHIRSFEQLSTLDLSYCQSLQDAYMISLQNLRTLKSVNLNRCDNLTGDCLQNLSSSVSTLLYLNCSGLKSVKDEQLSILSLMKNLESLDLSLNPSITGTGLQYIEPLTKLTSLNLSGNFLLEDHAVIHLSNLKGLRELSLNGCAKLSSKALDYIQSLTSLKILKLSEVENLNDKDLEKLLPLRNNLEYLDLSNCEKLSSEAGKSIAKLDKLKHLSIAYCYGITDTVLDTFKELKNLKTLDISGCRISNDAIIKLKKIRPDIQIIKNI